MSPPATAVCLLHFARNFISWKTSFTRPIAQLAPYSRSHRSPVAFQMTSEMDAIQSAPIAPGDHMAYLQYALSLAKQSPPKPTNFRVGAVLVNPASNTVVSTGYTLELPGNTHAEQCCFMKLAEQHEVAEEELGSVIKTPLVLYTTMEPCSTRLSGNLPCTKRILQLRSVIKSVYVGVQEPEKFVKDNTGRAALERVGIDFVHIKGLEGDILKVATAGHLKTPA